MPYTGFAWGIRDVIIGVLKCDASCITCSGPTQYDCLTCNASLFQVVKDGDCVCNLAAGYYNDTYNGNTCAQNCTGGRYMNPVTGTCTPDCSVVTYLYKYIDPATFKRYCYENCPSGWWKM